MANFFLIWLKEFWPSANADIIPQAALNAANFCELVTDGDAPPTNTFQFPEPCKSGLFLQMLLPTSIGFPE